MKIKYIYIFLERNMGNGYENAYPDVPSWLRRFYLFVIGNPTAPLSKRLKYLVFHREEIDNDCPDPRSKGRSPKIVMNALFPRSFDERHLLSKAGNDLLDKCWKTAKEIRVRGANSSLKIEVNESWCK